MAHYYTTFETTLGECGVLWSERGIRRIQLPELRPETTVRKLIHGVPDAVKYTPAQFVTDLIHMVKEYLRGGPVDFSQAMLDMGGCTAFQHKVYDATRSLRWGETASYGEIARRIGSPNASRAVGGALGANPIPIVIPCHRVLASGKKVGGFSAFGGISVKMELLALEGVRPEGKSASPYRSRHLSC